MDQNIGSSCCQKDLLCYFHVGGKFVCNDEGGSKYIGGSVKVKVIKYGITLDELKVIIGRWTGDDGSRCQIKYTVRFEERTLIDLDGDADIETLFSYNDSSGHVYVYCEENGNEERPIHDQYMDDGLFTLSREISGPPLSLGNDVETTWDVNSGEGLTHEAIDGGGPSERVAVEEEMPHYTEMSYGKWRGIISGLGQCFAHADEFRAALFKYSIANRFVHQYQRNSRDKIYVKCKAQGCPWKLCANAVGKTTPMLRVTKLINKHVHSAQHNLEVKHGVRSNLIASIVIEEVRNHVDKSPTEIRKTMQREYGVNLTYKQAYRAKEKAIEDICGRPEQSYMLIPWICQRLRETDDKTCAEWVANGGKFERVFIAYGSCVEGFLGGARHVLYVDGTHLSGPYKGTLLAASAYDADNELLPLAIAIVKGETLDDWTWFFYMIKQIVGSVELTIVSDRHNSIIGGVNSIFGGHRHAYCYRHVKENFSAEVGKVNRGKRRTSGQCREDALTLLDKVAYARLPDEFDEAMHHMRQFSPELHDWIVNQGDVNKWAMSKFPFKRWDNMTTNIAESFNAWMVKERKHNVAKLIHEHREKVAKKMHASYVSMTKWKNCVGPNIDAKVKVNVAASESLWGEVYGRGRICVHTSLGDQRVDLALRECSCAAWQMSGIPCSHACAAIKVVHGNVYEYVDPCYNISAQAKIYSRSMVPVVTIDMPHLNDYTLLSKNNLSMQNLLQPPCTSRPPGRPRWRRQDSQFQNKKIYHCTRCHESGHTRRTCKNPNPS